MSSFAIRTLTGQDWRLLRDLRLRALHDAPAAFGSSAADAERLSEEDWRRRLEGSAVFMARSGELDVGLVAGIPAESPGEAELISMWVASAWRGHGVGAALVDHVVHWAAEMRFARLRLWVAVGNGPAERLYARLGFVRTGEVQPMGKAGFDRVEFAMLRELAKPVR